MLFCGRVQSSRLCSSAEQGPRPSARSAPDLAFTGRSLRSSLFLECQLFAAAFTVRHTRQGNNITQTVRTVPTRNRLILSHEFLLVPNNFIKICQNQKYFQFLFECYPASTTEKIPIAHFIVMLQFAPQTLISFEISKRGSHLGFLKVNPTKSWVPTIPHCYFNKCYFSAFSLKVLFK